jgi:hypothetical protein
LFLAELISRTISRMGQLYVTSDRTVPVPIRAPLEFFIARVQRALIQSISTPSYQRVRDLAV